MSYANIFSGSKIATQYLPTEAVETPTLQQVLTEGDSANGQDIYNVGTFACDEIVASTPGFVYVNAKLNIGANALPPGSEVLSVTGDVAVTGNSTVTGDFSVSGGTISQVGPIGTGTVYDEVNNSPFAVPVVDAPFPYAGGFVNYGQITRITSNTAGSPGELYMNESNATVTNYMFGIIPDPNNTTAIQLQYGTGVNLININATTDKGKLIWYVRTGPSTIIRLTP